VTLGGLRLVYVTYGSCSSVIVSKVIYREKTIVNPWAVRSSSPPLNDASAYIRLLADC